MKTILLHFYSNFSGKLLRIKLVAQILNERKL